MNPEGLMSIAVPDPTFICVAPAGRDDTSTWKLVAINRKSPQRVVREASSSYQEKHFHVRSDRLSGRVANPAEMFHSKFLELARDSTLAQVVPQEALAL